MINNVIVTRRTFVQMLGAVIASTSLAQIPEFLTDNDRDGQLPSAIYVPQDPLAWIIIDGIKLPALCAAICMRVDMITLPPEPWMPVKRVAGPKETKLTFAIADDGGPYNSRSLSIREWSASDFQLHVPEFPGVYHGEMTLLSAKSCTVNGHDAIEVDSRVNGDLRHDRWMAL